MQNFTENRLFRLTVRISKFIWRIIRWPVRAGVLFALLITAFLFYKNLSSGISRASIDHLQQHEPWRLQFLEQQLIDTIRQNSGSGKRVEADAGVKFMLKNSNYKLPSGVTVFSRQSLKQLVITRYLEPSNPGWPVFNSKAWFVGRYNAEHTDEYKKFLADEAKKKGLKVKKKKAKKPSKKKEAPELPTGDQMNAAGKFTVDPEEAGTSGTGANPGSQIAMVDPATGQVYWNADIFEASFVVKGDGSIELTGMRLLEFTPIGIEEEIFSQLGYMAVRNSTITNFYLKKNMFSKYRDSQSLKLYTLEGTYLGNASLTRMRTSLTNYLFYNHTVWGPTLHVGYRGARSTRFDDYSEDLPLRRSETKWAQGTSFLVFQKNERTVYNPVLLAVNFIRDLPFVGPKPIVFLEEVYYNLKDKMSRWFNTQSKVYRLKKDKNGNDILPPNKPNGDLTPIISDLVMEGEGEWKKHNLKHDAAPSDFYYETTQYRPDPVRPFAVVTLLKIERRFFDLAMVAGTKEPQPSSGYVAQGTLPAESDQRKRVFMVISGGFKTFHSPSGMMVNNEIVRAPVDNRGTLALYNDGRLVVDDWEDLKQKNKIITYRQNCPIILKDGKTNRYKRLMSFGVGWGLLVFTWRTGLGFNHEDKLVYAIGNSLSIYTLARALKAAGVENAMQMDINDFNIMASWYYPTDEEGTINYKADKIDERVPGPADKFSTQQERDFIYMTFKE